MKFVDIVIVATAVLLISLVAISNANELGFAKTFQGEKYGTVTFDHLSHVEADCVGCHTEMKAAEGVTKDFGHGFCKDCHKATEPAPTKCTGCHVK